MEKKTKAKTKTRQRVRGASKRRKAHPQGPESEATDHIDNRDLNEDEQNKRVNNEEENAQTGANGESTGVEKT